MHYTSVAQILRKRGRHYQIIAPELEDFFSVGGDYSVLYRDPSWIADCHSSGANMWDWDVKGFNPDVWPWGSGATVELTFQLAGNSRKKLEPIIIDLPIFWEVLTLLGDSRKA